jgi:hypothetical protein
MLSPEPSPRISRRTGQPSTTPVQYGPDRRESPPVCERSRTPTCQSCQEELGSHLRISLSSNRYFRSRNRACFGISQGSFLPSLPFQCRTSPTGCKEGFPRCNGSCARGRGTVSDIRSPHPRLTSCRPRVYRHPCLPIAWGTIISTRGKSDTRQATDDKSESGGDEWAFEIDD